jgi:ferredoxin
MVPMMRGRNRCFTDLAPYLHELENTQHISHDSGLMESYPNQEIWDSLVAYARNQHNVTIGFTELPRDLLFKGKGVLFRYALVCLQEMNKDKIDAAPALQAGEEVQRVYNALGHAANDIARWLREKYAIKCQANHPLGGLVNSPPLAGKAGLGWQGMDGILITPRYGKRQRIALIFLHEKYFEYTDNRDHVWIEDYCKTCRRCWKACPARAIYDTKVVSNDNDPGFVIRTCIDREKCFPQFARTLGCSICIKVCPFSRGDGVYEKIKNSFKTQSLSAERHPPCD